MYEESVKISFSITQDKGLCSDLLSPLVVFYQLRRVRKIPVVLPKRLRHVVGGASGARDFRRKNIFCVPDIPEVALVIRDSQFTILMAQSTEMYQGLREGQKNSSRYARQLSLCQHFLHFVLFGFDFSVEFLTHQVEAVPLALVVHYQPLIPS